MPPTVLQNFNPVDAPLRYEKNIIEISGGGAL